MFNASFPQALNDQDVESVTRRYHKAWLFEGLKVPEGLRDAGGGAN